MNKKTQLAVLGAGALIASALIVGTTSTSPAALAGTGSGVSPTNNVYSPPTVPGLTFGATVTPVAHAPSTLATSLAVPPVKAVPLAAECNTTGMCP